MNAGSYLYQATNIQQSAKLLRTIHMIPIDGGESQKIMEHDKHFLMYDNDQAPDQPIDCKKTLK